MIPVGKYPAKIQEYGVSEAKNGNPQVYINLNITVDGVVKVKTWYGSFAGGAKDITLKTLIGCGLQPQNYAQLQNLVNGVQSGMLDTTKELEADIQHDVDQNGKPRETVAWLNDPLSAPGPKKIDMAKNQQFFASMGFDQDLMRLASSMGLPLNNGQNATMGTPNQGMNNFQTMGQNQQQQNFQQNFAQNQNPPMDMGNQNMNMGQQNFQQQTPPNPGQQNAGTGYKAPF